LARVSGRQRCAAIAAATLRALRAFLTLPLQPVNKIRPLLWTTFALGVFSGVRGFCTMSHCPLRRFLPAALTLGCMVGMQATAWGWSAPPEPGAFTSQASSSPLIEIGWGRNSNRGNWGPEDAMAARLLHQARKDLAAGRILSARRHLEILVGRHPDGPMADAARDELARIYADREAPDAGSDTNARERDGLPLAISNPTKDRPVLEAAVPARTAERDADRPDTARPVVPENAVASTQLAANLRSTIGDRIFFVEGSAEIGSRARALLAAQAAWLKNHPKVAIVIEAHADERGSEAYNRQVAAQRAEAAQARLLSEGVGPGRILIRILGRSRPVAACAEPECAAQNRRVVIVPTVDVEEAMLWRDRSARPAPGQTRN
jgi:peptidoglycan-associated lipoprotein